MCRSIRDMHASNILLALSPTNNLLPSAPQVQGLRLGALDLSRIVMSTNVNSQHVYSALPHLVVHKSTKLLQQPISASRSSCGKDTSDQENVTISASNTLVYCSLETSADMRSPSRTHLTSSTLSISSPGPFSILSGERRLSE